MLSLRWHAVTMLYGPEGYSEDKVAVQHVRLDFVQVMTSKKVAPETTFDESRTAQSIRRDA